VSSAGAVSELWRSFQSTACTALTHALLLPARVSALLATITRGRGLLRRSHDSSSSSPGTTPCLHAHMHGHICT
jgi:hypothetical protein